MVDINNNGKVARLNSQESKIILQPIVSQSHYQLGQVLAKQEQWEKAIASYRQALQLEARSEVYLSLAEALVRQGKEVEAIECYQKSIEQQPNLARAHHNLGDLLQKQGQIETAISAYRQAIELESEFSWSHNNLGDALRDLERWEEASGTYKKAIELNPNFAWSHYNLAEVSMKQEKWDEAILAYRAAAELQTDFPNIHLKIAKASQKKNTEDFQELIHFYAEQISKNPSQVELYNNALDLEPYNIRLYLGLAKALEEKKDVNQAIVFYNLALKQDPDCFEEVWAGYSRLMGFEFDTPAIKQKLSESCASIGNLCMQKTRKIYRQAFRLNPENSQLDRKQIETILKLEPDILEFEDSAIASQADSIDFYTKNKIDLLETHTLPFQYQQRIPSSTAFVDIIVCIHNALEDVKKCLDSIIKNTSFNYHLIIINDGSQSETSTFLAQWINCDRNITLIRNPIAKGYTKAANQGLQASRSDYILLLNSDTIVTKNWIKKLIECANSDPKIGVVGPLSNCASWQSIPELFDSNGDWAINTIPSQYSIEQYSNIVEKHSKKSFPLVSFVNGFCYMITRTALDSVGLLDEESFPHGYGEENDLSLRIVKAGFKLAIADHTYIYHAKSKSFGHQRRKELAKQGSSALKKKHPHVDFKNLTAQIKENRDLENLRNILKEVTR
ncbi:tetratricopeptide repeat protein [Oscillatoriales cyanobacterium LEGE 11467]|uniref:Tetratricopeptide repeat protein n=1 Tax=Zarconia navalis LEGE 11467 TaxID=1828826 RepID=A0A928VUJ3_9CYAN|nr:tetratricopeptide repeat protein [Zarconia navalis]MBE9039719.1 tetratricopeptide repeat protein [Zarconia navalis LEGE 11467]